MKQIFEVLATGDDVTAEDWQRFHEVISSRLRAISRFRLVVQMQGQLVRFFISSRHDLSGVSDGLDGFVIRPISDEEAAALTPPKDAKHQLLRKPRLRGSVLEVAERSKVLWSARFTQAELRVTRVGNGVFTKVTIHAAKRGQNQKAMYGRKHFPATLLGIDFSTSVGYMKRRIPKYVSIEKTFPILSDNDERSLFSIDTFPYLARNQWLNLDSYDFDKHSFIIGATGSGKSKFIELFVDRLRAARLNRHHIVVIDPHVTLAQALESQGPARVIDFKTDATQMFPDASSDVSAATELTVALLKSLINDKDNGRLERVLRYSVFVLNTAQVMSLDNLKRFLIDIEYRSQILAHVVGFVTHSVDQFFGADFNEIRTTHFNQSIQPIVALVDELALQPAIAGASDVSLAETIKENFLTVFSLNKVSMGEKAVKTVAGLLVQQIFLLAQARAFDRNVILIIDEVSVVQNPTMATMLAEARKFGLTVMLSQQYFDQIEVPLQRAILSNMSNYYVFKISDRDAETLAGNVTVEFPPEVLRREGARGHDEMAVRSHLMSELSPRECLVRVSANGRMLPAMLGRTVEFAPGDRKHKRSPRSTQKALPERFVFEATSADPPKPEPTPATTPVAKDLTQVFAEQSAGRREKKRSKK